MGQEKTVLPDTNLTFQVSTCTYEIKKAEGERKISISFAVWPNKVRMSAEEEVPGTLTGTADEAEVAGWTAWPPSPTEVLIKTWRRFGPTLQTRLPSVFSFLSDLKLTLISAFWRNDYFELDVTKRTLRTRTKSPEIKIRGYWSEIGGEGNFWTVRLESKRQEPFSVPVLGYSLRDYPKERILTVLWQVEGRISEVIFLPERKKKTIFLMEESIRGLTDPAVWFTLTQIS